MPNLALILLLLGLLGKFKPTSHSRRSHAIPGENHRIRPPGHDVVDRKRRAPHDFEAAADFALEVVDAGDLIGFDGYALLRR